MNRVRCYRGQSLYDVSVMACGTAAAAKAIADANGLALDYVLTEDRVLEVPQVRGRGADVATGGVAMRDGIGFAMVGELAVD